MLLCVTTTCMCTPSGKPPAIAGKPPVLDPSDPRLLKHSPLPLSTLMTSSPTEAWATNYRDNYTSPVQAECVFQTAAPLPLQTNRVSPFLCMMCCFIIQIAQSHISTVGKYT